MKLTPRESAMVEALLSRGEWTKRDDLAADIWPDADAQPEWAFGCIRVMALNLRKKGIPIEARPDNRNGSGYRIAA